MKTICKRLINSLELKREILSISNENNINAGIILSSVGSLSKLKIRLADGIKILEVVEPLEIISLNGTISKERIHLHISCSKTNGEVIGGHLIEGVINTTCELVIGIIENVSFKGEFDEKTGYNELIIKELNPKT